MHLTENTFEQAVGEPGVLLVEFWADRCGQGRTPGPDLERLAQQYPDVRFATVNTSAEPGVSGALGVRSVPTLMIFRDGILRYEEPGTLPVHALEHLIATVTR